MKPSQIDARITIGVANVSSSFSRRERRVRNGLASSAGNPTGTKPKKRSGLRSHASAMNTPAEPATASRSSAAASAGGKWWQHVDDHARAAGSDGSWHRRAVDGIGHEVDVIGKLGARRLPGVDLRLQIGEDEVRRPAPSGAESRAP